MASNATLLHWEMLQKIKSTENSYEIITILNLLLKDIVVLVNWNIKFLFLFNQLLNLDQLTDLYRLIKILICSAIKYLLKQVLSCPIVTLILKSNSRVLYTNMSKKSCSYYVTISIFSHPIIWSSRVFFCLKFKISITTEMIVFSILETLHIGRGMVLGYFIFRLRPSRMVLGVQN